MRKLIWKKKKKKKQQTILVNLPLDSEVSWLISGLIAVGSGSAGSVVTNRLSESHRVLLLEAGGTPHPMLRIPLMTYFLHGIGAVDWKWRTVPQKAACFGLRNNVIKPVNQFATVLHVNNSTCLEFMVSFSFILLSRWVSGLLEKLSVDPVI